MRSAVVFNFLIEANTMASIAIVLMVFLRRFLRKRLGNSALCFGWLLVALRLLCPVSLPNPLIHAIRSPFANDPIIRPIAGQMKVRTVDAISAIGCALFQAGDKQGYDLMQTISGGVSYNGYPQIFALLWVAGAILVLLWMAVSNRRFQRKVKENIIEPIPKALEDQYFAICKARGVKPVPVYFADSLSSACLVGVFHPYIVVPLATPLHDFKYVISHEVCHLKGKDHIGNALRMICCAVHWFNPIIWMAAAMHRTDCELRCDDCVSQPMTKQERRIYAGALVTAASRKNRPSLSVMATSMTMAGRRLKERVKGIIYYVKPCRFLVVAFLLLSSMCLIGAFATSETEEQMAEGVYLAADERYITDDLPGKSIIVDRDIAIDYARHLAEWMGCGNTGEADAYRQEYGYWCAAIENGADELFEAQFLTNGCVLTLRQVCEGDPWQEKVALGETTGDAAELGDIGGWLLQRVEDINPGAGGMLSSIRIVTVRDFGDELYLYAVANPLSNVYSGGLYAVIQINSNGAYQLRELSFVGDEW